MSSWPPTHGDTTSEYVAAHDEVGFIGGQHAVVWAVGSDATSFLQGIITQDVEALAPGSVARSLLLEPRGKLQAVLWVLKASSERIGLVDVADRIEHTVEALSRWRIRVDVEFEIDTREVHDLWGPGAAGLEPEDGWQDEDGVLVADLSSEPIRHRIVAGPDRDQLVAAGATAIGTTVADAIRIEVGEPVMGLDIDEKTIPQESGLVEESVAFDKGCYLGQELVARIDSRGRVNRHLRGVRLLDPVIPPVGARVEVDGQVMGTLTTVGESLALRAPVGLGLLRREVTPGSSVTVAWEGGSAPGSVEALPLATSNVGN